MYYYYHPRLFHGQRSCREARLGCMDISCLRHEEGTNPDKPIKPVVGKARKHDSIPESEDIGRYRWDGLLFLVRNGAECLYTRTHNPAKDSCLNPRFRMGIFERIYFMGNVK
jgi:hypothetical protein